MYYITFPFPHLYTEWAPASFEILPIFLECTEIAQSIIYTFQNNKIEAVSRRGIVKIGLKKCVWFYWGISSCSLLEMGRIISHRHNKTIKFATPWTIAHQALLSMQLPRQEYRSGFPCPPPASSGPRDRTRISCGLGIAGGFFIAKPLGKPNKTIIYK